MELELDKIYTGDALSILREQPSDSVDLIVTDPPYQLSSIARRFNTETDSRNGIRRQGKRWDGKPPDSFYRVSKGFMGKEWDVIPEVETWKECLRVLKPGAFAFILCTPRQDSLCLMISRLTEAGFDMSFTSLYWTYATGFSKGTNISKQVDKRLSAEREVIGINREYEKKKKAEIERGIDNINSCFQQGGRTNAEAGFQNPESGKYITTPATDQAKALDGSYAGFQPKPAVEVILVCMKSLSEKTFIDQALKNGKGITWLSDCKIPYESEEDKEKARFGVQWDIKGNNWGATDATQPRDVYGRNVLSSETGRFPANLLVSDDILDDGERRKGQQGIITGNEPSASTKGNTHGDYRGYCKGMAPRGDAGSFSRYFDLDRWFSEQIKKLPKSVQKTFPYFIVSKPTRAEKNMGCENLEEKRMGRNQSSLNGGEMLTGSGNKRSNYKKNTHPTIKPIKLLSYLIMLGSREGDVVLDPFIGSGTTALACLALSRHYVGIDIEGEYVQIAQARIDAYNKQLKLF